MRTLFNSKWVLAILFCNALSFRVLAQENTPIAIPIPSAVIEPIPSSIKHIAVGLSTGTSLFGIDGAINLNRYFNARIGLNYGNYHYENENFYIPTPDLENIKFHFNAYVKMSNISLLGEFKPFKGGRIRIVAGAAYCFKNQIVMSGVPNKNYYFNDVEFDPDEIGTVGSTISFKSSVSPYMALAFGRAVPKKRLNFSAEIGTYYKGAPQIAIDATAALRENVRSGPILTRNFANLNAYHFLPALSLRLAYKIM
jgi:hypothetical protein